MISIKARWEWWCRWNCDLRVINAQKKAFSVVLKALPWRPNHVTICLQHHSGESLQNGQLELRRRNDTLPERPTRIQPYQFEPVREDFERVPEHRVTFKGNPMRYSNGFCEIALTEVLATQMGVTWRSKKVSLFELYKFNPLSPHCRSIARELVHCYT